MIALLAAAVLAAPAERPAGLAALPPATEAREILGGHLVLQVPTATREIGASGRTDDTRLAIDAGEARMEIHATELFATAPARDSAPEAERRGRVEHFGDAVGRLVKTWGDAAESHTVTSGGLPSALPAFWVLPQAPDRRPTGAFVRGLFVVSPDGTVQYLEARVNAPAARDIAATDALAERILRSVAAGERRLRAGGGAVRLTTPSPSRTVFATAPDGVIATVQREDDRTVHRFQTLAPLGENAPSLTITFARDARYLHERLAREVKPAIREGRLFGQKVLWHEWSSRDGKPQLEAIVSLGTASAPLNAHLLILHRTEEHALAMRAIAESMVLERRPE